MMVAQALAEEFVVLHLSSAVPGAKFFTLHISQNLFPL